MCSMCDEVLGTDRNGIFGEPETEQAVTDVPDFSMIREQDQKYIKDNPEFAALIYSALSGSYEKGRQAGLFEAAKIMVESLAG